MSIYLRGDNENKYYDVRFNDANDNNKVKYVRYSIKKYGKYAKDIAEYTETNGIKLYNWFKKENSYTILYYYNNSDDIYEEILIDNEDYNKIKDYYWCVYTDRHEKYAKASVRNPNNKNEKIKLHRFIMNETNPEKIVDHIKGNGLDNRKSNLRVVTRTKNNQNKINLASNNKSGVMGVSRQKANGYDIYRASITYNGERKAKSFSIAKYGEEGAFKLACECRDKFLEEFEREFNMKNEKNNRR